MTKPFRYPCAGELIFRLATGELEIVYARDEGNGKIYATLKDTKHHGDIGRATDPARTSSPHTNDVRTE